MAVETASRSQCTGLGRIPIGFLADRGIGMVVPVRHKLNESEQEDKAQESQPKPTYD